MVALCRGSARKPFEIGILFRRRQSAVPAAPATATPLRWRPTETETCGSAGMAKTGSGQTVAPRETRRSGACRCPPAPRPCVRKCRAAPQSHAGKGREILRKVSTWRQRSGNDWRAWLKSSSSWSRAVVSAAEGPSSEDGQVRDFRVCRRSAQSGAAGAGRRPDCALSQIATLWVRAPLGPAARARPGPAPPARDCRDRRGRELAPQPGEQFTGMRLHLGGKPLV